MDNYVLIIGMVLAALIIFKLGCMFEKYRLHKKSLGNLRIDTSDDDGPYLFLELEKSVMDVCNSKYVVFKVRNENYLPRN